MWRWRQRLQWCGLKPRLLKNQSPDISSFTDLKARSWKSLSKSHTLSRGPVEICPLVLPGTEGCQQPWLVVTSLQSVSIYILPSLLSLCELSLFASGGQSVGASVSASVLPMNIQGWFPLGLTGLITLLSKGLSRVFSSTTVWKHQFLSLLYGPTSTSIYDYWKNHVLCLITQSCLTLGHHGPWPARLLCPWGFSRQE